MKLPTLSILFAMGLSLVACGEKEPDVDPLDVDDDGDGFTENQGDCDDTNSAIAPGQLEICDEIDNDCDALIDDADDSLDAETGTMFYGDADGDTYGDAGTEIWACVLPEGAVENMDDCNDEDADISPDATEVCDEIDNDCDGDIDDADDSLDASTGTMFYGDADADTYGDAGTEIWACVLPEGAVENMDDCDDSNAEVHPMATEICDEIDNDCDAMIDDADDSVDVSTGWTYYADTDSDGLGDMAAPSEAMSCAPAAGFVANWNDCDDTDAAVGATDEDADGFVACVDDCDDADAMIYPGAAELDSATECMKDSDDDGYGDVNNIYQLVVEPGDCITVEMFDAYGDAWNGSANISVEDSSGAVGTYALTSSDDCSDSAVCDPTGGNGGNPEGYRSEEICADTETLMLNYNPGSSYNYENSVRITDANGMVWEFGPRFTDASGADLPEMDEDSFMFTANYVTGTDCDDDDAAVLTGDTDGDGYHACDTENPIDCDDTDAAINPGVDADADGYNVCEDCDEGDATINPGATEVWYDGVDQDCDGWSDYDQDMDGDEVMEFVDAAGNTVAWTGYDCNDEDDTLMSLVMEADPTACYEDADGDGYGDDTPSSGDMAYGVIAGTDCYDAFSGSSIGPTIYPGSAYMEADPTLCYEDGDGDGYGDDNSYYGDADGTDCNDNDEFTYPGAAYLEADLTLCYEDADEDGYGAVGDSYAEDGTDCDDEDAMKYPGYDGDGDGTESCFDCDDADAAVVGGLLYEDADADGFGDMDDEGWLTCDLTALDVDGDNIPDYSTNNTDCDDGDEYTFPGAGFNELSPLNAECLTDWDGDGYAAGIPATVGLYEGSVVSGECFDVTIADSYSDGCGAFGDFYIDYVLDTSIEGPASGLAEETTQWCAPADGTLQIGWTEDSSWNSDCEMTVTDSSGTVLYSSGSATIYGVVPTPASGGTDADDGDLGVH